MGKKKEKHFGLIKFIFIIILICLFIFAYGSYIEPKQLSIKENIIVNDNITDNFDGFKIVGLSDIHYGNNFGNTELKKLVDKVNDLNPDIVVITGDLIDDSTKMTTSMVSGISKELKRISAGSGKYIISGEDDTKFDEWENIITGGEFVNLNNGYDTIYKNGYDCILIAGVSSFSDKESIVNKNQKNQNYINSFEKDGPIYKILLMHEPDYIDELEDNKYDLVLSGHSHGGQINIPFINEFFIPRGATKYSSGNYRIKNSELYVSKGIGTSDINFRLFNSPTIDVYRLIKSN